MGAHKRIDGDYVITTINQQDDVIINTNTVTVNGNLDVVGNLTYINVTELNVKDPFIVLNASNTASYPSNSGVLTHETSTSFAGIRYNATAGEWQLSIATDATGLTGTWTPIQTGTAGVPGGANTNIQFNDGGTFGGDSNFSFNKTTNKVTLDGHVDYAYQASTPTPTANVSTLYGNTPGTGATGLYFENTSIVPGELISKDKAIFYAFIF